MGIEDTLTELALHTRPGDKSPIGKGVLGAEELPLTGALAAGTRLPCIEGVQLFARRLQLVLVALNELGSQLRV